MKKTLCNICGHYEVEPENILCKRCLVMDRQVDFMIKNNRNAACSFLGEKLKLSERREKQQLYSPQRRSTDAQKKTSWRHLPDKRLKQRGSDDLKRRKGDE